MQIFRDDEAAQITLVQERRPLALVIQVAVCAAMTAAAIQGWSGVAARAWLAEAPLVAMAVLSFGVLAASLARIVATFDGKRRTLTLRREWPIGAITRTIDLRDVRDFATVPGSMRSLPCFEVRLAPRGWMRRIFLDFFREDRDAVDRLIPELRRMLPR
jgi:hypothetical protein